jgi:RNA polymerase sigma-70 factor (ECF subfamily)
MERGAEMVQNEQAAVLGPVQEKASFGMTALDDFTPLVQAHQQRIYRVLLGMVRDPDAAQTLTQECFLKAYQKRASFRGKGSAGVWLVKIAVNLARDHRRSRLRAFWHRLSSSSEEIADLGQRLPDPHASQERVLLGREEVAGVWSAVEKLSPQQRAVFVLRFVEEMSLEEIAEATSLRVGTVKTHLFRAVRAVRQRVKGGRAGE